MWDLKHIRNFAIIAHIDHGKSTLADRLMEHTGAVSKRELKAQMLDDMDLEREMGITIKANRCSMTYKFEGQEYLLNLLDTPGHVDFHYEVSRALTACEGVLLLVDASQGVQAQTVANAYLAVEAATEIIPVVNKIDLPGALPEDCALELEHVLGIPAEDAIFTSAKTGQGVEELFEAIIKKMPPPEKDPDSQLRALVYDAKNDVHRGVISHIRVFGGSMKRGDKMRFVAAGSERIITEVGKFTPKPVAVDQLSSGEVGYFLASIKTIADVNIGDTVTLAHDPTDRPLPGYQAPQQMVFCDFFPGPGTETPELRDAFEKLWLNDSSFTYEKTSSDALGIGFRCGFLGLLHMKIIQERLERESDVNIVQTAPTVTYEVELKDGSVMQIQSPSELPDMSIVQEIREPICKASVIVPAEYIGDVLKLSLERRGTHKKTEYLSTTRVMLNFEFPLGEIIYDYYDRLKSATRGYGTADYDVTGFKADKLAKLDILVNGMAVDALSVIVHRDKAANRGRRLIQRLKKEISRHQFEIPLQAAIGGKIIARETIAAMRKDVTAKCYGGDITRKRKLLEKQKEGKKRMKQVGMVSIPQNAFMSILDPGD
ncbi:MAG: elongation factor 4 [Planctomycetes bacterium]|nr:elongation factor 4 [Planctomycetota bacterium]